MYLLRHDNVKVIRPIIIILSVSFLLTVAFNTKLVAGKWWFIDTKRDPFNLSSSNAKTYFNEFKSVSSGLVCNSLGKCASICSVCGRTTQVCNYQWQTCDGSRTNGYKNIRCWAYHLSPVLIVPNS